MNAIEEFLMQAAHVKPTARQMRWYRMGQYAFVHFGVNTFTDREWGLGSESPSIFNPTKLDCGQWVRAVKSAGLGGIVLTAKHHDGFCLWPSAYTEHSVKNSPFRNGRGDVVRECADACARGGIAFGVYLSPWDRNSALYGTDAYNDYYKHQLTELVTGYGPLFAVWFDGACGEGPNGKRQVYDFDGYFDIVRRHQPDAVMFGGPDVRWIGNESGCARHAEWAVVPTDMSCGGEPQTGAGPLGGDLEELPHTLDMIGSLPTILRARSLCFCPAEVDMSIRPGWFYHENEEPHALERLLRAYDASAGGNACLNLNIPPTREGLFDERDVRRLAQFGSALRARFGREGEESAWRVVSSDVRAHSALYELEQNEALPVRDIVLYERVEEGQRVEAYILWAPDEHGGKRVLAEGTTIGFRRVVRLDPNGTGVPLKRLIVQIVCARDTPDVRVCVL